MDTKGKKKEFKKDPKTGSIFIQGLENWILSKVNRPHPIFFEIESFAKEENIPILNPLSGANLAAWIRAYKPKHILELGTGAGYSLLWILHFLKGGNILTIDRNQELQEQAKKFYERSPYQNQSTVRFLIEDWKDNIKNNPIHWWEFDFIFVDLDKIFYPSILQSWFQLYKEEKKVPIVCFDNVLWHGRVLNPNANKPSDLAILQFWEILTRMHIYYELVPSGDGILFLYPESTEY